MGSLIHKKAAAFAAILLKFAHTWDPHTRVSDAGTQLGYSWLSSSFHCSVFPGLWLMFWNNWDLQSSSEWDSWLCMKPTLTSCDSLWIEHSGPGMPQEQQISRRSACIPVHSAHYMLVYFILIRLSSEWNDWTLVLVTVLGNPPTARVRTRQTVRFGSRIVQKPDQLSLGGPNPDPYTSTCGFCRVWLYASVPISGCVFQVFLFMVAFRYPTPNRKIMTLVRHCPFRVNRLPLKLQTWETCSLPHPEHDSQQRVNDICSCIMGNLGGD